MSAQSHRSDPRILGRRTLQRDHRVLADLLRPGMSVLDVGCGTGAITAGIASAVGPAGRVVGIDRDEGLLAVAKKSHERTPSLTFARSDATELEFSGEFDIVTAARTLQWIADSGRAVGRMKQAARAGGMIVVLDYNHEKNGWEPEPPPEFRLFYSAFLVWRRANQWDNNMADHLPGLFRDAGLNGIESHMQDEVVERGDANFDERAALWAEVIEGVGERIAQAGFCNHALLREAQESYLAWVKTELVRQTLAMSTVIGSVV
jgi:ubiquinone/menaquinone biosynthesis C-methylase UbiE